MSKAGYKRLFGRRGFNLIEISIVVVVLGILGSALLVPLGAILIEEQYTRERAAVERARLAVIGYAARSATPGAVVQIGGAEPQNTFAVPAGRAYFPCPDITGDGHEDRNHYNNTGVQIVENTNTPVIDVGDLGTETYGIVTLQRFDAATNNGRGLKTVGSCAAMRGFLPWKTLGLPPADTWGNLRTYAVDYAYSHGIVGFNRNTIADNFYAHGFVDDDLNFPRRVTVVGEAGGSTARNFNQPIGLCLGVTVTCNSGDIANLTLAYGDRVSVATVIAHRNYQVDDLRNGLIFVIVSHGRNGFGAGQYRPTPAVSCNPRQAGANNRENANYPFTDNPSNAIIPATNTNCSGQDITQRSAQFFTIRRRNHVSEDGAFDDVMTWATREQVNEAITRDSPDLPLYVPRCADMRNNPPMAC